MANFNKTTSDVFIPEIWSKDINMATEKNLVMAGLVWRVDGLVKDGGDVVHIPNVTNFSARDKAEGSDITFDANTETDIDLNINVHKYVGVKIEDLVATQSSYDLRSIYTDRMGYAVANAIDSSLLGLYSGLSQSVSAGAALTDAHVISALEKLDVADVPRSERQFVFHSEALADMRGISKYTEYQFTGERGVANSDGQVSTLYGVPVYFSNNVVETAGSPNLLHNLLFHKDAFVAAIQMQPKTVAEYSVDSLAWKVATQTIYGVAENRDLFAVDIQLNS